MFEQIDVNLQATQLAVDKAADKCFDFDKDVGNALKLVVLSLGCIREDIERAFKAIVCDALNDVKLNKPPCKYCIPDKVRFPSIMKFCPYCGRELGEMRRA